jgi:hypothetical protein
MNSSSRESRALRGESTAAGWDFLTNHAHVLLCVARDPGEPARPLRHPLVSELEIGDLLGVLVRSRDSA